MNLNSSEVSRQSETEPYDADLPSTHQRSSRLIGGADYYRLRGNCSWFAAPVTITSAVGQQISGNGAADTTEHGALHGSESENQDSVFLELITGMIIGVVITANNESAATFTVDDTHGLPSGDGSNQCGRRHNLDSRFEFQQYKRRLVGDNEYRLTTLEADLSGFAPGPDTVIGFFRSGSERGGIGIQTVSLHCTRNKNKQWVGDQNVLRPQGQFVIQNNLISDSETYGILIDAPR